MTITKSLWILTSSKARHTIVAQACGCPAPWSVFHASASREITSQCYKSTRPRNTWQLFQASDTLRTSVNLLVDQSLSFSHSGSSQPGRSSSKHSLSVKSWSRSWHPQAWETKWYVWALGWLKNSQVIFVDSPSVLEMTLRKLANQHARLSNRWSRTRIRAWATRGGDFWALSWSMENKISFSNHYHSKQHPKSVRHVLVQDVTDNNIDQTRKQVDQDPMRCILSSEPHEEAQ